MFFIFLRQIPYENQKEIQKTLFCVVADITITIDNPKILVALRHSIRIILRKNASKLDFRV